MFVRAIFPKAHFRTSSMPRPKPAPKLNGEAPQVMFDTITEGTRRALEFSIASSVTRFLLVSSGAVYGNQPPELTHVGEAFKGGPIRSILHCLRRGQAFRRNVVHAGCFSRPGDQIARCLLLSGPYMQLDAHFAIGNFIADCLHHRLIRVKGDGSAVRSYLYASDLMVWLWTILFKGQSCRAYNVGSEEAREHCRARARSRRGVATRS